MTQRECRELLMILWNAKWFSQKDNESRISSLSVFNVGNRVPKCAVYSGAEIKIDNRHMCGSVAFLPSDNGVPLPEDVVLCVSESQNDLIRLDDFGREIAVIQVAIPEKMKKAFERLFNQSSPYDCGHVVSSMEKYERFSLFTSLYVERLKTKSDEVLWWFEKLDRDWNKTMYMMLMRSFGESVNKEPYTTLAQRVPIEAIYRERNNIVSLEALLIGGSGLLDSYPDDKYTIRLHEEFDYLSKKYSIQKMSPSQWALDRVHHYNQPINRLATIAMLFHEKMYMFDTIMKCTEVEQLHDLFCIEASEYWSSRSSSNRKVDNNPKRIGHAKAELLGINFVAIMRFAYGSYLDDESLKTSTITLMETIPVEQNRITSGWRGAGVVMDNAFDAQAMLQLYKIYCNGNRCVECPVGKKIIKEVLVR